MSTIAFIMFLNKLGKRDKMRGLTRILSLLCNKLNNFNKYRRTNVRFY